MVNPGHLDFAIWAGGTGGQGSGWWNRVCIRERVLQTRAADPTEQPRKTRKPRKHTLLIWASFSLNVIALRVGRTGELGFLHFCAVSSKRAFISLVRPRRQWRPDPTTRVLSIFHGMDVFLFVLS